MVFPYSEFREKTIQGIDMQVEGIAREGFGERKTQIVQRAVSVTINRVLSAQAEDVGNGLQGMWY
jgi:hypothetical protein